MSDYADLGDLEPSEQEVEARHNQLLRQAKIDQKLHQRAFQQYMQNVDAQEFENAAKMYGKDVQSFRAGLNKPASPEQVKQLDKIIRTRTRQAHAEIYRVLTNEEPVETERVRDSQGRLTGERRPVAEQPAKKPTERKKYGEDAALEKATEMGIFDWMRSYSK